MAFTKSSWTQRALACFSTRVKGMVAMLAGCRLVPDRLPVHSEEWDHFDMMCETKQGHVVYKKPTVLQCPDLARLTRFSRQSSNNSVCSQLVLRILSYKRLLVQSSRESANISQSLAPRCKFSMPSSALNLLLTCAIVASVSLLEPSPQV